MSQRLLAHHGGLRGLFRLDVVELTLKDPSLVSRQRDEVSVSPLPVHC
jgi:hypothetical protein